MNRTTTQDFIENAIHTVSEASPHGTYGKWLEHLTIEIGPHIKEWDLKECHLWSGWPDRVEHFPETTNQDIGIDVVAIRRSDGGHIAIQCKSRKLDKNGRGDPIQKKEIDKFANASSGSFWAERWIVTNGDNVPEQQRSAGPVDVG